MGPPRKAVVIGGCGFVGTQICHLLAARGYRAVAFDLRRTMPDELAKDGTGIEVVTGSIKEEKDLLPALRDAEFVIHTVAGHPFVEDRKHHEDIAIEGTKSVLAACKKAGVKRLVLCSSASIPYRYRDMEYGDETIPAPDSIGDVYMETKARQEQMVIDANSHELMTCSVRPHTIWGPGDRVMMPTVLEASHSGKLIFIGDGCNLVDYTYVKNIAHALILAGEALAPGSPVCGSRYICTDDSPIHMWTLQAVILTRLGFSLPRRRLPWQLLYGLALVAAAVLRAVSAVLRTDVRAQTFTPQKMALVGTYRYYSNDRARKDFGYRPLVPVAQAVEETVASLHDMRKGGEHWTQKR